jgi:hypothetical protein
MAPDATIDDSITRFSVFLFRLLFGLAFLGDKRGVLAVFTKFYKVLNVMLSSVGAVWPITIQFGAMEIRGIKGAASFTRTICQSRWWWRPCCHLVNEGNNFHYDPHLVHSRRDSLPAV